MVKKTVSRQRLAVRQKKIQSFVGDSMKVDRRTPKALSVEQVSAGYGGSPVLREVSLGVEPGEMLGVLGPNGSGKTTLLRVMTGLVAPEAGTVHLGGEPLGRLSARERAKRLAVVVQEHEGLVAIRVWEAVAAGRTPYLSRFGGLTAKDRRVMEEVMVRMAVAPLANRWIHTLSSGERQRVWMAMALAQEPQVLCLDEPTSHLDLRFQIELMEYASSLCRSGVAVVWVSHDVNLAARYCGRLAVMSEGRVAAQGLPLEVITSKNIQRVFGSHWRVEVAQDGFPMVVPEVEGRISPKR